MHSRKIFIALVRGLCSNADKTTCVQLLVRRHRTKVPQCLM